MTPKDFPPWNYVYKRLERWFKRGTWEKGLKFPTSKLREKVGKYPEPTFDTVDFQSVPTSQGSEECGFDGGKIEMGQTVHMHPYNGQHNWNMRQISVTDKKAERCVNRLSPLLPI